MTASIRAENYYATILDYEHGFAELVTYHTKSNPAAPRTIIALVRPKQETQETEFTERDVQTYTVSVGRIESHEKGGVNVPQKGDRIQRASETDQDALMAFTGRVLGETPHSFRLEFTKPITKQIGTSHQRR